MTTERLLQRFLTYVQIDTTAIDDADCYPSSPGQMNLGELLAEELRELGAKDVSHNEHGIVMATIPGTEPDAPTIAFNAHLDTSPETTGKDVKPQVIRDYQGGDIQLPGDASKVLTEEDNPEFANLRGATIITTDGTTLLGGDDKAGVAVIVETAARLLESNVTRGDVRVLFTCDEEIGHGVDYVDIEAVNATACYTLDGAGAGEIDIETFSADQASIKITGKNIHPAIAKGQMINALRVGGRLIELLPKELAPETTAGRDGFLHPWQFQGGVAEATVKVLLRDFDNENLTKQANLLNTLARQVENEFPGASVDVRVSRQYRNLGDGLAKEPRAVSFIEQAYERLGRECKRTIVRGGTDGSQLTEKGLPTPNLSTGQHKIHSPYEWACLDEMEQAVELLLEVCQIWGAEK